MLLRMQVKHGPAVLYTVAKPWPVQTSISDAVGHALRDFKHMMAMSVDVYPTNDCKTADVTPFEACDFSTTNVQQLSLFGVFVVVRCRPASAGQLSSPSPSTPVPQPGGSSVMGSATERVVLAAASRLLPPPAADSSPHLGQSRIAISNALIRHLDGLRLGWDPAQARPGGSGFRLLSVLSKTLEYVYRWIGPLKARGVSLPERFHIDELQADCPY